MKSIRYGGETIKRMSIVLIGGFVFSFLIYFLFNKWFGRNMGNEGGIFWTGTGTLIAAIVGAAYGSSYAFELNRSREEEIKRDAEINAGRWILVVLALQITYLARILRHIHAQKTIYGEERWPLLMQEFYYFQDVPEIDISQLRFLANSKDVNLLIELGSSGNRAAPVMHLIRMHQTFKMKMKDSLEAFQRSLLERSERGEFEREDLDPDFQFSEIPEIIGPRIQNEIELSSRQILVGSEEGVTDVARYYNNVRAAFSLRYPDEKFAPLELNTGDAFIDSLLQKALKPETEIVETSGL